MAFSAGAVAVRLQGQWSPGFSDDEEVFDVYERVLGLEVPCAQAMTARDLFGGCRPIILRSLVRCIYNLYSKVRA